MKTYLAGKIEPNGWRQKIFNVRDVEWLDKKTYPWEPVLVEDSEKRFGKRLFITGPFFIACDHSCAHGPSTHGAGNGGCVVNPVPTREDIANLCLRAIDNCDFFFAWIDSPDAFGTFFEIGYAHAKNKDVFLCFLDGVDIKLFSDLWFMRKVPGVKSMHADNPEEGIRKMMQSVWSGK